MVDREGFYSDLCFSLYPIEVLVVGEIGTAEGRSVLSSFEFFVDFLLQAVKS